MDVQPEIDPRSPVPFRGRWSTEHCRRLDQLLAANFGLSGLILMENAGLLAALSIERSVEDEGLRGPITVVCGGGNNGGDGYVVARQLAVRGHVVRLASTVPTDRLAGDALVNRRAWDALGHGTTDVPDAAALLSALDAWGESACFVDAVLGTGFAGPVRATLAEVLALLDAQAAPSFALDVPSGIDADRGEPWNVAWRAARTLTFAARKIGFDAPGCAAWTGPVECVPIGAPAAAYELVESGLRDVQ